MTRRLSKRQYRVIDDLFSGEADEAAVLAKHKLSRNVFNKWLGSDEFQAEFARRIDSASRQSRLIIARYAPLAAARLIALTESDKDETARKACLDILSQQSKSATEAKSRSGSTPKKPETQPLEPHEASKLLAVLAEESKEDSNN